MDTLLQVINFLFNYTIFRVSGQPISFYIIAHLIVNLIIAVVISQLIKLICQQWLLEKLKFDVGNREAFSSLIFYFFITLGTVIVLQSTGINLASLAVVAGGLGIGIGFGLQSIARDFISGLILLLGRSIKVDDFVQFGQRQEFVNVQGTVQKISVYIILSGSVEIFVPKINKHLATLRTGDFFGELSLIFGILRTASVRTFEKTLLFVINKQGFNKILHEQSELAEVIIEELAKHQKELAQRQEQLREMGLISQEEDDTNLVNWIRKRFHNIFSLPD